MRQVCAQWALSQNEWIYEISSRRARYALKILLKLSPFNATFSCDRNEIDVHFRDWMVGREVPMSHHSKRGFAKRTPHESSQNLNFGCLHTHTQRVNIWRGEEEKTFGCAHLGAPLIFGNPTVNSDLNLFMKGPVKARLITMRNLWFDCLKTTPHYKM